MCAGKYGGGKNENANYRSQRAQLSFNLLVPVKTYISLIAFQVMRNYHLCEASDHAARRMTVQTQAIGRVWEILNYGIGSGGGMESSGRRPQASEAGFGNGGFFFSLRGFSLYNAWDMRKWKWKWLTFHKKSPEWRINVVTVTCNGVTILVMISVVMLKGMDFIHIIKHRGLDWWNGNVDIFGWWRIF